MPDFPPLRQPELASFRVPFIPRLKPGVYWPYILKAVGLEMTEISENFFRIESNEISPGLMRVGGYRTGREQDSSSRIFLILVFRILEQLTSPNEFRIVAT